MPSRTKTLIAVLLLAVVVSVVLTYYRSFVARDFEIIPVPPESGDEESSLSS